MPPHDMSDSFRDQVQDALAPALTIEREITGGGMSRVFVAKELSLGRTVVVKVLRPDLAAGVNRERFRREIMLAAQLQHPHIVPVLTAGERDDLLWYTMPFVEGESLREALVHRGRFGAKDVIRVLHDVLDALDFAHQRGVIHRDIKPANILTHGAHALIADFGVAKALSASLPQSGATTGGIAIGTPAYMAPEQLAADPSADHRMDLYAVGLLAYELLSGSQPFSAASPAATMAAQLTHMPAPIEELRDDVPPALASLVMRLLAKRPDERPPSAGAALEELDDLLTPKSGTLAPTTSAAVPPVDRRSDTPTAPAPTPARRPVVTLAAIGAVLVLGAAGYALFARTGSRDSVTTPVESRSPVVSADTTRPVVVTPPAPPPNDTASKSKATRDTPRPTQRRVAAAESSATSSAPPRSTPPRARPAPAPKSVAPPPGAPAALVSVTGRPKRVALLPVRDVTQRPAYGSVARALEDSLRRATTAAGYALATDAELVRLMAENDVNGQRRLAESMGIGAVVAGLLSVGTRELNANVTVMDVWRNVPQGVRSASELQDSTGTFTIVRDVMRVLNRVSWRHRDDPRRVLVFDFDNLTGHDSLGAAARVYTDSVRALVAGRLGLASVGDSASRATRDPNERRLVGVDANAGAIVAGSLGRRSQDSLRVRVTVRDMSDERTFEVAEFVTSLREPLAALTAALERVATDLQRVNWGPRAFTR